MPILDSEQVKGYLPHRPPFLFVDTVEAIELGKSIHARKQVSVNETFFDGHFPGNPVLPGVIQLEAMMQAGALLAVLSGAKIDRGQSVYVGGLNDVRFKRPVRPGETLDLFAELLRQKMGIFKMNARTEVCGEVCTQATITATTGPALPQPPVPDTFPAPPFAS